MKMFEYFPTLHNPESYFERISDETQKFKIIINLIYLLVIFTFAYGLVMGSYHSWLQAGAAATKLFVLYFLAIIICFPAFFIIQYILGSTLHPGQMLAIILSGFVLMSAIMVSFAPIIIFFILTGGNYYFLQLLHIAVFILGGFFGMRTIHDALLYSCEKKKVYPRTGVVVFRFWIIILAFVGIQLAWNLRPFLGDANQPFKLFRNYEGNFYTALIYSVRQLSSEGQKGREKRKPKPSKYDDTLSIDGLWKK